MISGFDVRLFFKELKPFAYAATDNILVIASRRQRTGYGVQFRGYVDQKSPDGVRARAGCGVERVPGCPAWRSGMHNGQ